MGKNKPTGRTRAASPKPVAVKTTPEPVTPKVEAPEAATPEPVRERQRIAWGRWALVVGEPLSVAAIFIYMLHESWLRWMDPFIDFPRNLYLAWRISEGDMLYQKVTNDYGPLSDLAQAAGFRIFGVGIDTLIWMNIALTVGVILLVRAIFGSMGNRFSKWLCSVVFVVVFGFGHYVAIGNYNFIAPYASQAIYGFAGLLLMVWGLLRHLQTGRGLWLGVAGLGLAVVYLDKAEVLLAALGALGIYLLVHFVQVARQAGAGRGHRVFGWVSRTLAWGIGGFLALWLPIFGYFFCRGGFSYAFYATNFVPETLLNPKFQNTVEHAHLMQVFIGFDHWQDNLITQLEAGGWLGLALGVMVAATWGWTKTKKYSPGWWILPVIVVASAVGASWWLDAVVVRWINIGEALVFPVVIAGLVATGWSLWSAWKQRADFTQVLGLAVVGVAAALMLARMILHGRIFQFGFFMMPLAALFVVHLVAGEAMKRLQGGARWLLPVVFGTLVLSGVFMMGRLSLNVYWSKTYQVGEGRDHFFTYQARVARTGQWQNPQGPMLNLMLRMFRLKTPDAKSLVVFPEGIGVNYLLRVPSTLQELEFHPVALGYVGPQHVVDELRDNKPEAIFLCYRSYVEFGSPYFGYDEASGLSILKWIATSYRPVAYNGKSPNTATRNVVNLLVIKPLPKVTPVNIFPVL